jgi:hypothetical protein|eukprot:COSAG01_NODE_704_length_14147_cov_5.083648_5_plen_101_part_00
MSLLGAFAAFNAPFGWTVPSRVLLAYGRCPLFFYIIHLWVIQVVSLALNWVGEGVGLQCGAPLQYVPLFWAGIVALMFFLCEPYGRFKLRQPSSSLWRFL